MDWVVHSDIKITMLVYDEINKNKKEYEKINLCLIIAFYHNLSKYTNLILSNN